jgi:hypothetical protein
MNKACLKLGPVAPVLNCLEESLKTSAMFQEKKFSTFFDFQKKAICCLCGQRSSDIAKQCPSCSSSGFEEFLVAFEDQWIVHPSCLFQAKEAKKEQFPTIEKATEKANFEKQWTTPSLQQFQLEDKQKKKKKKKFSLEIQIPPKGNSQTIILKDLDIDTRWSAIFTFVDELLNAHDIPFRTDFFWMETGKKIQAEANQIVNPSQQEHLRVFFEVFYWG